MVGTRHPRLRWGDDQSVPDARRCCSRKSGEASGAAAAVSSSSSTAGGAKPARAPEEQRRLARRQTESLTAYEAYQKATVFIVRPTRQNLEAERELWTRAIEIDPGFPVAHAVRGLALARQARLLEATRSVRRALRLSPRAPISPVLISLAYVNLAADRRQEAVQFLEQARTSAPEALPGRVLLAAPYEQEDAHAKAQAEVAEVLRIRLDLTVETAMELVAIGPDPEELAEYPALLHAAGCRLVEGPPISGGPKDPCLPLTPVSLEPSELSPPFRTHEMGPSLPLD